MFESIKTEEQCWCYISQSIGQGPEGFGKLISGLYGLHFVSKFCLLGSTTWFNLEYICSRWWESLSTYQTGVRSLFVDCSLWQYLWSLSSSLKGTYSCLLFDNIVMNEDKSQSKHAVYLKIDKILPERVQMFLNFTICISW